MFSGNGRDDERIEEPKEAETPKEEVVSIQSTGLSSLQTLPNVAASSLAVQPYQNYSVPPPVPFYSVAGRKHATETYPAGAHQQQQYLPRFLTNLPNPGLTCDNFAYDWYGIPNQFGQMVPYDYDNYPAWSMGQTEGPYQQDFEAAAPETWSMDR